MFCAKPNQCLEPVSSFEFHTFAIEVTILYWHPGNWKTILIIQYHIYQIDDASVGLFTFPAHTFGDLTLA